MPSGQIYKGGVPGFTSSEPATKMLDDEVPSVGKGEGRGTGKEVGCTSMAVAVAVTGLGPSTADGTLTGQVSTSRAEGSEAVTSQTGAVTSAGTKEAPAETKAETEGASASAVAGAECER